MADRWGRGKNPMGRPSSNNCELCTLSTEFQQRVQSSHKKCESETPLCICQIIHLQTHKNVIVAQWLEHRTHDRGNAEGCGFEPRLGHETRKSKSNYCTVQKRNTIMMFPNRRKIC